ncbi:hypothetical protein [Zavarzinella formosa]|uniref:hypothetical protein n=1 Tax=Zavarzinella formosa TaxID=360055 RepID=UPI0012F86905|nr:hypothetical protein [Zavarzinella formosa]
MISSKEVFRGATNYLNSHTWDEGRTYGLAKNEPSADLTSAAPMVRYLTGTPLREPALRKAAEAMALNSLTDKNPVLHQRHYFESQFLHLQDGPEWKTWGNAMRTRLITTQFKEDLEQNNVGSLFRGSWTTDAGDIGDQYGRLGCTAMSLLSLEVYFRYVPPLKRTKGGLTELER